MRCPLDDAPMHTHQLDTINLDVCPTCAGIWFDGRELTRLIERLHVTYLSKIELPSEVSMTAQTDTTNARSLPPLMCPHEHGQMHRRVYAGNSRVWIDVCDACGGVWCDGGEFSAMLQAIEPTAIDATLARLLTEDAREDAMREQQAADFLQYLRFMISPGVGPWSLVIVTLSLIARYLIQDSLERSTKAVPSSTIN